MRSDTICDDFWSDSDSWAAYIVLFEPSKPYGRHHAVSEPTNPRGKANGLRFVPQFSGSADFPARAPPLRVCSHGKCAAPMCSPAPGFRSAIAAISYSRQTRWHEETRVGITAIVTTSEHHDRLLQRDESPPYLHMHMTYLIHVSRSAGFGYTCTSESNCQSSCCSWLRFSRASIWSSSFVFPPVRPESK